MPLVRPALLSDASLLAEVAEATFRDTFGAVNTEEDMTLHCRASYSPAIQAAEIAAPDRATLLAWEEGQLVGFAQLRWAGGHPAVTARAAGEIQRLYVAKAWHGRGIAPALMDASLAELQRRGSDVAWLGVWEKTPRAIAFYRKFGFVEAGEHVFVLGHDRQRDLVMMRPLATTGRTGLSIRRQSLKNC